MGSDTNPYGYRCAVATREKTAVLSLRTIVLFTLHALLNAIIRCLQLNTGRCRGCNPEGGLLVIDAVGLTVYVFCVMPAYLFIVFILQIIVQRALFVNCPSVIRLPSMCYLYGETPLVNCGSRSFFLNITAILYYEFLLSAIYFLQTILQPHDKFNPLCSAKPVSLRTSLNSWCKVFWLFVCRFPSCC